MPRVRKSARTKGREKRKQDEVMDSSHSDSPQSDSWGCPPSSKKHLIPDAMVVSSRRASLRSAKRLIEGPSVSRCSQPQRSREHSAANDVSQQPDDLIDKITTSEYQASAGSLQSPQVANPSTLTPATRHEADSASLNVNNLVEEECIPLEQEPLAEYIQASNGIEERVNKGHSKSTSTVAHPCPSFSFNLTEMVKMWDDEEDEVNSVGRSLSIGPVDGHQVKPENMPILKKIISKHGDIANNCTVMGMKYRSHLLEIICDIITELQDKDLSKIKEDDLQNMISAVNELKTMKLEICWLHQRLVDILEARQLLKQSGTLKDKKESNRKMIENVEKELEECETEKMAIAAKYYSILQKESVYKERLARERDESTMIDATIADAKSKVRRFLSCSLVDGLL